MDERVERTVTPQWITVKEELLNDFYDLAEYFSNYQEYPNDSEVMRAWIKKLRSLFLKVKTRFKEVNPEMHKSMEDWLYCRRKFLIKDFVDFTIGIMEYIDNTGITDVRTEKQILDPGQAIRGKFKNIY